MVRAKIYWPRDLQRLGVNKMTFGPKTAFEKTLDQVWINDMIKRVAPSIASVLIVDDIGTRKSAVALQIHNESARKNKPLVSIDCGELSETLLESELFGHEKGAFTGAYTRKIGLIEIANNGTLVLNEVDRLSAGMQAKILSFLKTGEFTRVGGKKRIQANIRLISAVSVDLEDLVNQGQFREDLFYAVNPVTLKLPSGKEPEPLVPITNDEYKGYPKETSLYDVEKDHVLSVLKFFNNDKKKAAESLGLTIKTLYNKLHEYGEFDGTDSNN